MTDFVRFIGDVHGKFEKYRGLLNAPKTIQVGDMGVGFDAWDREYFNPPNLMNVPGDHRFIRGNHDNPEACAAHPAWIKDGTYENGVFYVGGAFSIDWQYRTEGYSWWKDEELSIGELSKILDLHEEKKPSIVVSHDCPNVIAERIHIGLPGIPKAKTRTGEALTAALTLHRPKLWIYGHWHEARDEVIDGTRFICLPELACMDIDLETYR